MPITAEGERENVGKRRVWGQDKFRYDPERDIWECPPGAMLRRIIARPVADKNGRMTWK